MITPHDKVIKVLTIFRQLINLQYDINKSLSKRIDNLEKRVSKLEKKHVK